MTRPATTCFIQAETSHIERIPLAAPFAGMFAWPVRNLVGESPIWDAATGTLLWIDVRAPAILRLDPGRRILTRWVLPLVIGAIALVDANQAMLALQRQLAFFHLGTGALSLLPIMEDEPSENRLNEGKLSPSGKWFVFGSMDDRADHKQATGALYRADLKGHVVRLHQGLAVANGLAWSPDRQTIYFSDSFAGIIWQAAWDEQSGAMGQPMRFASSDEAGGRPDGALVDKAGHYLSAGVSAGCLNRFDPHGRWLARLPLPVRAPTMPCLGGGAPARLFVTSLVRPSWTSAPGLDGSLIEMEMEMEIMETAPETQGARFFTAGEL